LPTDDKDGTNVLAIRMWIKIDYCVPIMAYDDLVHYITYK